MYESAKLVYSDAWDQLHDSSPLLLLLLLLLTLYLAVPLFETTAPPSPSDPYCPTMDPNLLIFVLFQLLMSTFRRCVLLNFGFDGTFFLAAFGGMVGYVDC